MALTPKRLAEGQLPNAKGTLYTVPGATTTLILRGTLVNTGAVSRNVNIYLKKAAGTSRRIIPKDRTLNSGDEFAIKGGHVLEAGDLIEGDAAAATEVDYYFSGLEKT